MQTQKQRKYQRKYKGFVSLVEAVADELYTKKQWDDAREASPLQTVMLDMLENVYDTAFTRQPETFNGIQWINSDFGIPAWVRPGVKWEPENA